MARGNSVTMSQPKSKVQQQYLTIVLQYTKYYKST